MELNWTEGHSLNGRVWKANAGDAILKVTCKDSGNYEAKVVLDNMRTLMVKYGDIGFAKAGSARLARKIAFEILEATKEFAAEGESVSITGQLPLVKESECQFSKK